MPSRSNRLAKLALAVVGLVAILVAFFAGRVSAPRSQGAVRHAQPQWATPATDAEAFAVEAVRELNSPAMVDVSYRKRTLARYLDPSANWLAERFVPGLAFEQTTGLAADERAGRATVAEVVPLALSATATRQGNVDVSVWAVSVVGTRRFGQLVASWSTESLTVRREASKWRVVAYRSTPGPVPAATQPPTNVLTALSAVSGMRSVDDAN